MKATKIKIKEKVMLKAIILGFIILGTNLMADVHVNGYYKSNGTYVDSYYRTSPNSTVTDNYSYRSRY